MYILKKYFRQHQISFPPNSFEILGCTELIYCFLIVKRQSQRATFKYFWYQDTTSSTKYSVNTIVHIIGFTNIVAKEQNYLMKILLNWDFYLLKEWLELFLKVIVELKSYLLLSFLSLVTFCGKHKIKLSIYHYMKH